MLALVRSEMDCYTLESIAMSEVIVVLAACLESCAVTKKSHYSFLEGVVVNRWETLAVYLD